MSEMYKTGDMFLVTMNVRNHGDHWGESSVPEAGISTAVTGRQQSVTEAHGGQGASRTGFRHRMSV